MLSIVQGLTTSSLNKIDRIEFNKYDKNGDGVISFSEFNNFLAVTAVGRVNNVERKEKGFNVEQFDPQGSINLESNGGHNAKFLNILA